MEEAAGSPIHPGARCGDLEVHEFVGRGAHSTVYRATDALLHRDVALKVVTTALGEDGSVRLTDFGLGRFIADEELRGETRHPRGTPYSMAPEVVMGLLGTPHSDLWSVGVLLYRMLTGRHPFPVQTIPSLSLAIQNAMPPPLDPSRPPQLVAIALHCLAKAPHDRPTSATAILEELDRGGELTLRPEVLRATAGHTPSAVVGRHLELDTIRSHVNTAARGEGQTVLLMGEPGIGKTALAAEIGREVRTRGFRWIEARLSPIEDLRRPLLNAIRHCLEREAEAASGDSGASSSTIFIRPTTSAAKMAFQHRAQVTSSESPPGSGISHLLTARCRE